MAQPAPTCKYLLEVRVARRAHQRHRTEYHLARGAIDGDDVALLQDLPVGEGDRLLFVRCCVAVVVVMVV